MLEDYFEKIDTFEKAYWLGFLITDGSVKGNVVKLDLSIKDECIIDDFIKAIHAPIERKKYCTHKLNGKEYFSVLISVISKKMVNDLKKYNVVPLKTFICSFPQLDTRDLDLALLSGCFDGDGCSGSTVICSGNYNFLQQIKSRFDIPYKISQKNANLYVLSIGIELLSEAQEKFSLIERKKTTSENYLTRKQSYLKYHPRKKLNNLEWLEEKKITLFELEKLVEEHGLVFISKKLNCSDKKLKNVCKHFGIHLPSLKERAFKLRKCKRPSKKQLQKLLEKHSFVQVGKMFGVSDNSIRKWLK